jgi:hypothetical protein
MEAGNVAYSEQGTPQGGVISPLLSNIYLHEVLDSWFVETVQPLMKGKTFIVRYADDAIIGCEKREDADRIMKVLALRFVKYGLTIHPEKIKLVDFTKPVGNNRNGNGSFTFLGFRHYWTTSRKGNWIVGRKTDGKRLSRALKAITQWCRMNRHTPRKKQLLGTIRELSAKLSVARSENRTFVLLSESFSRGTGCRGPTVRKLGTSGSVGAPGR